MFTTTRTYSVLGAWWHSLLSREESKKESTAANWCLVQALHLLDDIEPVSERKLSYQHKSNMIFEVFISITTETICFHIQRRLTTAVKRERERGRKINDFDICSVVSNIRTSHKPFEDHHRPHVIENVFELLLPPSRYDVARRVCFLCSLMGIVVDIYGSKSSLQFFEFVFAFCHLNDEEYVLRNSRQTCKLSLRTWRKSVV